MSKKVKIITFHSAINHGAAIQAYALMKTVKKLGLNVEIIDYRPRFERKQTLNYNNNLPSFIKKAIQYVIFRRFCRKYLSLTKKVYKSNEELLKYPPKADYFICGSDQIWSLRITKEIDPAYFLAFPVLGAKRIAYGVSMGKTEIPESSKHEFSDAIKKFDCLSAREKFTRDRLLSCKPGKPVPIVLDPSLLLSDYSEIMPRGDTNERYIAVYFIVRDKNLIEAAIKLKKVLNMPLVNLSTGRLREADRNEYFLNPGEWLKKIKCSSIVCTNSFHGTALSVLFEKKFYTTKLSERFEGLNNRMIELLEPLG
ncbi:MAG: polysaccharide pyruvyl transferase family protein, partial [Candidatus Omnitrophota bacterium]